MSYILDALRRSQAERERGQVPGLDAQTVPSSAAALPRRGAAALWLGGGLGLGLLIAMGAFALLREPPQPASDIGASRPLPAAAQTTRLPAATQTARLPAATQTAPLPQATQAAPLPQATQAPPLPQATQAAPLPVVVSVPPAPGPAIARPRAAAPALAAASSAASAVSVAARRAVPLAELSAEQRRDLPPLALGGSIWSESAANRFVIVNGVVVREGEAAAPGVTLERIGPRGAVLRWREVRFEVPL